MEQIILYTTTILHILLGLYSIKVNRKSKANITFGFLSIGIALWALTNILFQNTTNHYLLFLWALLAYNAATFMLVSNYFFSIYITNLKIKRIEIDFSIAIAILSLFLPYIPQLVIRDVSLETRSIITGPLIYVLFFTYLYFITLSLKNLIKGLDIVTGKERKQLINVLKGLILIIVTGVTFNLILPALNIYKFVTLGPSFTIIFLLFVYYSIIKYQFLDIRILLGRISYYALMGSIFMASYYGIYFFDKRIFGNSETTGAFLMGPINAILFAIFFAKFNDFLRKEIRSRIINAGYDPLEVVNNLTQDISRSVNIKETIMLGLKVLSKTLQPDFSAIIIIPKDKSVQKNIFIEYPKKSFKLKIDEEKLKLLNQIWRVWTKEGLVPINYDLLEYETPKEFKKHIPLLEKVRTYMKENNIKLIMPLRQTDDNIGILLLGPKEAEYPYTFRDMDYVDDVATTIGMAVTRSLYFMQVQDLNKNLEQKVKDATAELEKRNRSLNRMYKKLQRIRKKEQDMTDIMGHELRTPITIVRNVFSILEKKLKENQKITKSTLENYVERGLRASEREITLVETLLSATKADAGRLQVNLQKHDLKTILKNIFDGYHDLAKQKGLEFTIKAPKENIEIYVDKVRFQEIVDNFVSNAIKYTQKGKVEIVVKELPNNKLKLSVVDTGMGISKEDLKKLGKKFYRAKQHVGENQDVVRPGGTGLGLYVAFNLAKLMMMHVEVKSKVGQGSTFSVIFDKYTGQPPKTVDQTFKDQSLEIIKKELEEFKKSKILREARKERALRQKKHKNKNNLNFK